MITRLTAAMCFAAFAVVAAAQTAPVFEVVSIKATTCSPRRNFNDAEGGHFAATTVALGDLVRISHGVRPAGDNYSDLVNGGVGWLYSDCFDIRATATGQPSRTQLMAMIRTMLADRFHLRVHSISREETVFELHRVRDDGPLGPGLKPSTLACDGPSPQCSLTNASGRISATTIPIDGLARMLSGWVDGHVEVQDRTGLAGRFSVELTWTPTQEPARQPDGIPAPPVDPAGPALGTALREQLGLRLVASKRDVPLLVVDAADKPSPD